MKRLLILAASLFMAGVAFAERNSNTVQPVVQAWSLDALEVYVIGGATTSAASFDITNTSITFTTAGGLHPGATGYVFADTDKDTLVELVTYLNAVPVDTAGAEGGIVASVKQGCYDGDASGDLATHALTSCFGSAEKHTLVLDSGKQMGISYIFPASQLADRRKQFHITGINTNVTYGSGSAEIKVYDGDKTTDPVLLRYKANATTVETPVLSIPQDGTLAGSPNTALRVDVVGSAAITAGYLNIFGFKE